MRLVLAGLVALLLAPSPIQISARSRSLQPGELVVLSIVLPEASDQIRVRAFDRDVVAYPDGERTWRALVGVDLDVKPGTYPVTVEAGAGARHLRSRDRAARLPHAAADRERGLRHAAGVRAGADRARSGAARRRLEGARRRAAVDRPFVRPVPQEANSAFGTRSIFNGKPRNAHGGADFLSPGGTPIHAPNAGRIAVARNLYFSGNTVIVDHGLGLFSMLAHLSAIDVHEGDRVTAGQILGRVGATGRVTGPHLHWAVRASGARVDPLSLLALLGTPASIP